MSEDILDKSEFDEEDDRIAFIRGGLTHHKIIPIMLRPKVIFPFQIFHLEIHDEHWKKIVDKARAENSVVGFMYRNEETEHLPALGRVATSAAVAEVQKTVGGSYLVQFISANRFFTNEYVETEPVLQAEVSYYRDHPEDDAVIEPLTEKLLPLINRLQKIVQKGNLKEMSLEELREDILMHSFISFCNHPRLTAEEQLTMLWMYKLSGRLELAIELFEAMLTDELENLARTIKDAKNN